MTIDPHKRDSGPGETKPDQGLEADASQALPQLPPDLAALESSLGALSPSFDSETATAIAYEAARRVGFDEGRQEGRSETRERYRVMAWAGSISSGAIGVAASVLVMLAMGTGLGDDATNRMAGRNDDSASQPSGPSNDVEPTSEPNDDSASATAVASDEPAGNSRSIEATPRWVGLTRANERTGRSWQFEKLRWTLDYDARIQNGDSFESRQDPESGFERSDYLKERNRILSDANLL